MTGSTTTFDAPALRAAFGRFPSGVVAVCVEIDGERVGMAVSSFVAVSLDPPLVAFCVQNTSTTWPRFGASAHIGISVLGEVHHQAARTLAQKAGNRFDGLVTQTTDGGAVFVDGAVMWLDVSVTDTVPAGDHAIVLMHINDIEHRDGVLPIIFHDSQFRRLVTEI
ncbi:flavin reductase family protein (plasmid) [Rhodococcus globerulus]|uniref:flavin reductase family protein n=1 Tax=Rhodococcus globerulus TaxID=33008 RepID=UPI0039E9F05F